MRGLGDHFGLGLYRPLNLLQKNQKTLKPSALDRNSKLDEGSPLETHWEGCSQFHKHSFRASGIEFGCALTVRPIKPKSEPQKSLTLKAPTPLVFPFWEGGGRAYRPGQHPTCPPPFGAFGGWGPCFCSVLCHDPPPFRMQKGVGTQKHPSACSDTESGNTLCIKSCPSLQRS